MSLTRMALTDFRCFNSRQDLQIKPLTIVLGKNNSGKSALLRSPKIIETGFRGNSGAPLDLDMLDEAFVESFTDLIYAHRRHGSITLELDLADESSLIRTISAKVQNLDEYRTQIVSEYTARGPDGDLKLIWNQRDPTPGNQAYDVHTNGALAETDRIVEFQGLLPARIEGIPGTSLAARMTEGVIHKLRGSYPEIRYFAPFRERPLRRYRLPVAMPRAVGSAGEFSAGILASDFARFEGQMATQINDYLREQLGGWKISVQETGGLFSILLTSSTRETLVVNLADSGTGLAQELPIYVQRALDLVNPPAGPVLEIIEQPELHLHPAAHAGLADLYLNAISDPKLRFLIETHSETFLLRLRRRVAEGKCGPNDIGIFFVEQSEGESVIRPINLEPDGTLDYWPTGVFSEDYEEARAIAVAQTKREHSDAG